MVYSNILRLLRDAVVVEVVNRLFVNLLASVVDVLERGMGSGLLMMAKALVVAQN